MISSNQQELKCEECHSDLVLVDEELVCSQCGLVQNPFIHSFCRGKRFVKIGKLDQVLNYYLDASEKKVLLKVRGKRLGSKGT
jgi:hypothetical protein